MKFYMEGVPAVFADAPTDRALQQILCWRADAHHSRQLHPIVFEDFSQCIRLLNGARKSIEDKAFLAVVFTKTLPHDADGHLIRDEFSCIHVGLCLFAKRRALFYSFTKHIARRDVEKAVSFYKVHRLRTFSGTRGTH